MYYDAKMQSGMTNTDQFLCNQILKLTTAAQKCRIHYMYLFIYILHCVLAALTTRGGGVSFLYRKGMLEICHHLKTISIKFFSLKDWYFIGILSWKNHHKQCYFLFQVIGVASYNIPESLHQNHLQPIKVKPEILKRSEFLEA